MGDLRAAILARLDAQADDVFWLYRGTVETLLDLHKPVSNESWSPERLIVCSCSPGEDDQYDSPYPCPTVLAIAGRLGVEIAGR